MTEGWNGEGLSPSDVRSMIEDRLRDRRRDDFSALASSSLMMAFNDVAPVGLGFSEVSADYLEIKPPPTKVLDTRGTSTLVDRFTSAVAALGREIRIPTSGNAKLSKLDYASTPLYMDVTAGGVITLRSQAPNLVMGEEPVDHVAARALDRLVNLLPESSRDDSSLQSALGARVTSRRAVKEVAEAVASVGNLDLVLHRGNEVTGATMTTVQSSRLRKQLNVREAQVEVLTKHGVLDGARSRRRLFYLDVSNTESIEGVIDEELVEPVLQNLTQRVVARIERTRFMTKAGMPGRPAYRLVALEPDEEQLS